MRLTRFKKLSDGASGAIALRLAEERAVRVVGEQSAGRQIVPSARCLIDSWAIGKMAGDRIGPARNRDRALGARLGQGAEVGLSKREDRNRGARNKHKNCRRFPHRHRRRSREADALLAAFDLQDEIVTAKPVIPRG